MCVCVCFVATLEAESHGIICRMINTRDLWVILKENCYKLNSTREKRVSSSHYTGRQMAIREKEQRNSTEEKKPIKIHVHLFCWLLVGVVIVGIILR